jgi:ABC-type antimicrobial peptide transport system permease subunit
MYGGGTNLVGRSLDRMEIVGVIGNLKEDALNAPDYPYVYYCIMGGNWPDPEYVVRASGDPSAAIRQLVHNADPTRAVFGMKKLAGVVDADLDRPRSNAGLMGLFAIVAMTLAAAGLHGLVTQIVNARRQEIGVRIALGASQARILRSVLGSAAALAGLGIAAGTALTLALGRILQSVLFGIGGSDKWSILAAASLLGIVSILAAVIPARRAAAIDPMEAIRAE